MSNTLRIKRRAAGGAAGAPGSLANGELAYNEQDNILYYGWGVASGVTAAQINAIAGPGAFMTLNTTQSISGDKTWSGAHTFAGAVGLGSSASAATPPTSDNSTLLATTAFVKNQNYLLGLAFTLPSIFSTAQGVAAGVVTQTTTLANQPANIVFAGPSSGGAVAPTFRALVANDIPTLTSAKVSDFDTQVRASRLDQMAAPTSAVSANSQRLTNLADPTSAQDAATKAYADSRSAGLDPKDSVRVVATANIALSGLLTIDGVTLIAGDRVLVNGQTTASGNGIYVAAAGAWSRSADFTTGTAVPGAHVFVTEGTLNASSGWVMQNATAPTIGTTSIAFVQFSGAGEINAGTGLSKSGNTLNVSTIPLANGGSGATTAAAARTNFGLLDMATQASIAVAITGGSISGLTTFDGNMIDGGTF